MAIHLKRVYDPVGARDGTRVLVDALWPRGVARSAVDLWLRDVAPSGSLRRWFGHVPTRWEGFRARYLAELVGRPDALQSLRDLAAAGDVTLLFAARDREHNNAVVLAELLDGTAPR
jgi:uncharacterized protein YeaO (DUF488 family)